MGWVGLMCDSTWVGGWGVVGGGGGSTHDTTNTTAFVVDLPLFAKPCTPLSPPVFSTIHSPYAQRNQFTDMGNADLKCMVCLKLLAGEKGALEHARATSHQNFGQI